MNYPGARRINLNVESPPVMLFASPGQVHPPSNRSSGVRHLLIAALAAAVCQFASAASPADREEVKEDSRPAHTPVTAPNWILPDANGAPVSLYGLTEAGKTTVMVFWATWCESCLELLTELSQLHNQQKPKSVHVVLMNAWEDDDPMKFLAERELNLPVILQTEMVAQRYNITTVPGIVVVAPDKRITYIHRPKGTNDKVVASLRALMLAR